VYARKEKIGGDMSNENSATAEENRTYQNPTLRADQVGSLLRPEKLKAARAARQSGQLSAITLRAVEDECIREAVDAQHRVGLHAVTDGDFRRSGFHVDFLTRIEGIAWRAKQFTNAFKGLKHNTSPLVFEVDNKIRHVNDITVDDFSFLQSLTNRISKVTLPAPSFVHARGGRESIDRTAYPQLDEFYDDLAAAYRAEIRSLAKAGCRYVQLDEVHYTFFCDPSLVQMFTSRGDSPQELAQVYAKLINESFRDKPKEMISGVHLCRGNRRSAWVASGGYEPVAEVLFNTIEADRFLLEFDDERSGGFEPLRFVPKGKIIVLGLVSSKIPTVEHVDMFKRRIDEASHFVPIDQLALSPQCGFASSVDGNITTEEAQWAKFEVISKVAEDVWGTSA
jgi:5-methyltetrahydropteroyltriglutamate--homocysteine methyltransferase